jgi:hypothetical protein
MVSVITKRTRLDEDNLIDHCSGDDNADNFFDELQMMSNRTYGTETTVRNYLDSPVIRTLPNLSSFPSKTFSDLFVKYNTAIPSSAAVERMFSMGKDVLKPKRSKLSDEHFEMLVFLKDKCN